jgi:hypothetical protein
MAAATAQRREASLIGAGGHKNDSLQGKAPEPHQQSFTELARYFIIRRNRFGAKGVVTRTASDYIWYKEFKIERPR